MIPTVCKHKKKIGKYRGVKDEIKMKVKDTETHLPF